MSIQTLWSASRDPCESHGVASGLAVQSAARLDDVSQLQWKLLCGGRLILFRHWPAVAIGSSYFFYLSTITVSPFELIGYTVVGSMIL
jgi:hypothetical protein